MAATAATAAMPTATTRPLATAATVRVHADCAAQQDGTAVLSLLLLVLAQP